MLMTIFSTFPTINISKRMDKHLRVIWIAKDLYNIIYHLYSFKADYLNI